MTLSISLVGPHGYSVHATVSEVPEGLTTFVEWPKSVNPSKADMAALEALLHPVIQDYFGPSIIDRSAWDGTFEGGEIAAQCWRLQRAAVQSPSPEPSKHDGAQGESREEFERDRMGKS